MKNLDEITEVLTQIDDPKLLKRFLQAILTEAELNTIADRWELVKRLDQGESQRHIARELHLSLCKITRGSKELQKHNSALRKVLNIYKSK